MIEMKLLGVLSIVTLTMISCIGIRGGKLVQNFIASGKVGGLAGVILLLNAMGSRPIRLLAAPGTSITGPFSLTNFTIALVAVLWAYEGWHVISFVAGEMKRPTQDLPRSLIYGTAIVMLIFVAANLGYYRTLSPAEIQSSNAVAASAVQKVLGSFASSTLSVLILISVLGSLNGMILTGPRVYYAMAREGLFPRAFGRLSDRYGTPAVALAVQGAWAATLATSGSYQQLFTDVIFTAWIFYGLAVAAVLVLRRTQSQLKRPFSVPGYPWLSLLFCAAAAGVIFSTLVKRPGGASVGLGLLAIGIPVYFLGNGSRPAFLKERTRA